MYDEIMEKQHQFIIDTYNLDENNKKNFYLETEDLLYFLQEHFLNVEEIKKREQVFLNKTEFDDSYIKNKYKIRINKAKELVINVKGYILANEIKYTCKDKNILEIYNNFLTEQDENKKNDKHLQNMLVKGSSYEILYMEDGEVKFEVIDPKSAFIIYSNDIKPVPVFGIRIIEENKNRKDKDKSYIVEVYSNNHEVFTYRYNSSNLTLINTGYHVFNGCPIICYSNDEYHKAVFDDIVDEITTVNNALTSYINNVVENNNSPAYFYGVDESSESFYNYINENEELTEEEKQNITANLINYNNMLKKKYGYIPATENFKIEYPQRPINSTENESVITQLYNIIYNATQTVDLSHYSGDVSGKAMKIKMKATDTLATEKIYYMDSALKERLKLYLDLYNNMNNTSYKVNDFTITFQKQNFEDLTEISTAVKNFKEAGYSMKDVLSKDPQIQDVIEALANIEEEKQKEMEDFTNTYLNNNKIEE